MAESTAPATGSAPVVADRLEPRARRALVLLLIAVFVVFLNETTMSVAVPSIMDDLGVTPATGQWLTTAFALTMAVVIPVTGWLLQRVNTRPVFIAAMSLFSVGTLIAALAPVFELLIVGRVVQAAGTAIMMPLMMTTVLTIVPMHMRGRIMGRVSIVISVAPAIGPAVSGVLLSTLHWRGLFWVMLPLAVAMLVIGILLVPNVGDPRRVPLDGLSVVLSAFAFSGLVYGLSSIGESAQGSEVVAPWIPLAIGAAFMLGFVLRQLQLQRRDAALLDLRTFRAPSFTIAVVLLAIGMVSLFGMVIVLPIYLQNALGLDPLVIGGLLLPGGLLMGLMGPVVGNLYDRIGPRPLVVPGAVLLSLGLWGMAMFAVDTPLWGVIAAHVVVSLGLGLLFTPLFTSGLGALPPHLYSHGSALVATIQQVAAAAGTAVFITFLTIGMTAAGAVDTAAADPTQVAAGSHLAFLSGAIVSLVVVAVSFFVRKPTEPEVAEGDVTGAHPAAMH